MNSSSRHGWFGDHKVDLSVTQRPADSRSSPHAILDSSFDRGNHAHSGMNPK
jgi:hypothetical protein